MKHIFKLPFIAFVVMIFYTCYTELGVTQIVDSYVMDVSHMFTFTIIVSFLMYGLYSALRDIFVLLQRIKIEDQKSNPPS